MGLRADEASAPIDEWKTVLFDRKVFQRDMFLSGKIGNIVKIGK